MQRKIVEVDYYELMEKMKRAADKHKLIERSDKTRWKEYVNSHNVQETSLEAIGKVRFMNGKPRLIAIEMGDEWDGCYVYSKEDEVALKWVVVE